MKDHHVTGLLVPYKKGELNSVSAEKVKTHLIFCNVCRDRLNRLETSGTESTPQKTTLKNPKDRPVLAPVLIIGVLAVGFLGVLFFNQSSDKSIPLPMPAPTATPELVTVAPEEETAADDVVPEPLKAPEPPKAEVKIEKPVEKASVDAGKALNDINGALSGITNPESKAISTAQEWNDLWARHINGQVDRSAPPAIDFEQSEVIAIFAGSQPSAGYSVQILKADITSWNGKPARVVTYRLNKPPANGVSASVITYPFALKVVPKINGDTFFTRIPR